MFLTSKPWPHSPNTLSTTLSCSVKKLWLCSIHSDTVIWISLCQWQVLVSIVVSIPACHAGDRGSIPRRGGLILRNVERDVQDSQSTKHMQRRPVLLQNVPYFMVILTWSDWSLYKVLFIKSPVPGWARTTNLSVNSRTRYPIAPQRQHAHGVIGPLQCLVNIVGKSSTKSCWTLASNGPRMAQNYWILRTRFWARPLQGSKSSLV